MQVPGGFGTDALVVISFGLYDILDFLLIVMFECGFDVFTHELLIYSNIIEVVFDLKQSGHILYVIVHAIVIKKSQKGEN